MATLLELNEMRSIFKNGAFLRSKGILIKG
jgi:hypothetical protein